MRMKSRIAAAAATGIVGTILMASPSFAASGPKAGTCDGTGAQLRDRAGTHQQDRDRNPVHLQLRIHRA